MHHPFGFSFLLCAVTLQNVSEIDQVDKTFVTQLLKQDPTAQGP
jgi:hypothetical protein